MLRSKTLCQKDSESILFSYKVGQQPCASLPLVDYDAVSYETHQRIIHSYHHQPEVKCLPRFKDDNFPGKLQSQTIVSGKIVVLRAG
jgi:hypothetical protein